MGAEIAGNSSSLCQQSLFQISGVLRFRSRIETGTLELLDSEVGGGENWFILEVRVRPRGRLRCAMVKLPLRHLVLFIKPQIASSSSSEFFFKKFIMKWIISQGFLWCFVVNVLYQVLLIHSGIGVGVLYRRQARCLSLSPPSFFFFDQSNSIFMDLLNLFDSLSSSFSRNSFHSWSLRCGCSLNSTEAGHSFPFLLFLFRW